MTSSQQIFSTVTQHLYDQGHPAHAHNSDCVYNNPDNGDTCAVGCLIPPSLYNPDMEGKDPKGMVHLLPTDHPTTQMFTDNLHLLGDLQQAHDECPTDSETGEFLPEALHAALSKVAITHKLALPGEPA